MAPLGTVSNFTLVHRAGYSCYVRLAYCSTDRSSNGLAANKLVLTDRIQGAINLGDTAVRSLKEAGVPEGAEVQLVIELVAAGSPMRYSEESWTYSEDSFRTGTYKASGTVFNPKLERVVRRRPPPPPPPMQLSSGCVTEKSPLLCEKEQSTWQEQPESTQTVWSSITTCLTCSST